MMIPLQDVRNILKIWFKHCRIVKTYLIIFSHANTFFSLNPVKEPTQTCECNEIPIQTAHEIKFNYILRGSKSELHIKHFISPYTR